MLVIAASFFVGVAATMFAVAYDRGRRRRAKEARNLSALLGTVYQNQNKNF